MSKAQIMKWERAGQTRKEKLTTRSTLPTNTSCFHTQIYTYRSTYPSMLYSLKHSIVFIKSVSPAHIGTHTHTYTATHLQSYTLTLSPCYPLFSSLPSPSFAPLLSELMLRAIRTIFLPRFVVDRFFMFYTSCQPYS